MTEAEIQRAIINRHKKNGWFVTKLIQTSTNGIPDVLLIKDGRVVFIEVKRNEKLKPSPLQIYMHDTIRAHKIEVVITSNPDYELSSE